ncbi:MAG: hypothetical protein ABIO04_14170 [Ferruginibacter sp.]
MKTQLSELLLPLSNAEVNTLTTIVKETLASEKHYHSKNFSAAELWDIQRRQRTTVVRRRFY